MERETADAQITMDETGSPGAAEGDLAALVAPDAAVAAPLPAYVFEQGDLVDHFAAVFVEHAARRGVVLASAAHLDALLVPPAARAELEVSTPAFEAMQRAVPHTTALECARACRLAAARAPDPITAADLDAEAATWLLADRLAQPVRARTAWRAWAADRRARLLGGRSVATAPPRTLREVATVADDAVALETFLVKWLECACCTPAQRAAANALHAGLDTRCASVVGEGAFGGGKSSSSGASGTSSNALDSDETLVLRDCWTLLRAGDAAGAERLLAAAQPLVGAALCGWAAYDGGAHGNPNRRAWAALCAAAAVKSGTTIFRGFPAQNDPRAKAIGQVLNALGVRTDLYDDAMTVRGGTLYGGECVDSHGDSRIAMSVFFLAPHAMHPTELQHAEAVLKADPSFFERFRALGGVMILD